MDADRLRRHRKHGRSYSRPCRIYHATSRLFFHAERASASYACTYSSSNPSPDARTRADPHRSNTRPSRSGDRWQPS